MSGQQALELTSVSKSYSPAAVVLHDIDLTSPVGSTIAITGPSGAGKSTMLNLLGTLEAPTSGTVRIAGIDTSGMSDRQLSGMRAYRIGFVFQQFHLLEHLTVLDNVATGLLYRGGTSRDRRAAASQVLEQVGLASKAHSRPSQLSGGERQRTAIARAIVGRPTLLLADEPTGNLDTTTGSGIIRLLAGLADERTTVVVITHDPVVAAAMGRQVQLRDGRIIADSGPR